MKKIEIDIDIHKLIENARKSFSESENDILKRLLGLFQTEPYLNNSNEVTTLNKNGNMTNNSENIENQILDSAQILGSSGIFSTNTLQNAWIYGGATLQEGTILRKWTPNKTYQAVIKSGQIYINEKYYKSPSAAAMSINGGTSVNGWIFWEYFDDVTKKWEKISKKRKNRDESDQNLPFKNLNLTSNGDDKFISHLPNDLKELGKNLISRIREFHTSSLTYHDKSGKFVENPNFYTIIIQPKVKSLRITIWGQPNSFITNKIILKSDMRGYSAFKLSDQHQIPEAVNLILQAKNNKLQRNN